MTDVKSPLDLLLLVVAAIMAGTVNSLAGGGTLITFPSLLAVGLPARVANATNTMALWPGLISSLWGYRRFVRNNGRTILLLGLPSLIGGTAGALLLSHTTDSTFALVLPWLILMATGLFASQGVISNFIRGKSKAPAEETSAETDNPPWTPYWYAAVPFQFIIGLYGGYFGAGIGILILTNLGLLGFSHMHKMNGLKNIFGALVNVMALAVFITARLPQGTGVGPSKNLMIDWPVAGLMACGSIAGGYMGSRIARKVGQIAVRRLVVVIGVVLSLTLLLHPATH